jgi:hypothetical protein
MSKKPIIVTLLVWVIGCVTGCDKSGTSEKAGS